MEPSNSAAGQSGFTDFHPAFYIMSWMFLSNTTILFNKYLLDTAGFPITLTALHLATASLLTQILARHTSLIVPRAGGGGGGGGGGGPTITGRLYLRTILPIGLLYTVSLACANLAYLYLSVPFIQMLKALAPVVTLLLSWAASLADPRVSTLACVLVIAFGVFLAGVGEVRFVWAGFFVHLIGTIAESGRLLLVQTLLKGPQNGAGGEPGDEEAVSRRAIAGMNPLVALYYYAPVCAVLNFIVAAAVEFKYFDFADLHRVGYATLGLNCIVAFLLNVAGVFLIGKTSALAMNLTGILKSILLVLASLLIWATPITFLQIVGYGIALGGMFYYSLPPEGLAAQIKTLEAWLGRVSSPDGLKGSAAATRSRELLRTSGEAFGMEAARGEGERAAAAVGGGGAREEEAAQAEPVLDKVEGRQD